MLSPAERAALLTERIRRAGLGRTNASAFRGVSWHRERQAWYAKVRVASKLQHLGRFSSPEAAARAWQ